MRFIIGTNNKGKLAEMQRILEPLGIEVLTVRQAGFEPIDPEEGESSFEENARIKASAFCAHTGMPSIADDSGLCVDALGGAPGVLSARYAGEPSDSEKNIDKLLDELSDVPDDKRSAHFACTVCCAFPNGDEIIATGKSEGYIGHERRGNGGFGYDPVFMCPDGRSFSEISDVEKDAVSHRGRALKIFAEKLGEYLKTRD